MKLSVCLATYNGEKYIREQLDSILPQLSETDEIVISDDGSTDKTLDIIQSYNDARIRIFHHNADAITSSFPLDRPTHNFENALVHAQGDIIFLSDQDDVWLPGKVETIVDALKNADAVIHDCMVCDEGLNKLEESYFNTVNVTTHALCNIFKCTLLGCCMAMRKEVLSAALPFPKTKVGHDLWLGLVADTKFRFHVLRKPYLKYRKHDASMTTAGRKSKYGLWFKIGYRITILKHYFKLKLSSH